LVADVACREVAVVPAGGGLGIADEELPCGSTVRLSPKLHQIVVERAQELLPDFDSDALLNDPQFLRRFRSSIALNWYQRSQS
jgi:hypothetical protein